MANISWEETEKLIRMIRLVAIKQFCNRKSNENETMPYRKIEKAGNKKEKERKNGGKG